MAEGMGVNLKVSLVKATTWGSAATVNAANAGLIFTSFSWKDNVEALEDAGYNADAVARERALVGRYQWEADFTVDLKYQGLDVLQALFFGTAGVPTGGGPYVHTWYRKVDMTGVFGSFAWDDGINTHTIASVKIGGLTYTFDSGRVATLSGKLIGNKRTTGATGGLGSVTEPSAISYVQSNASICTWQLVAQASSVAAQDMNKASVTFARNYPIDDRVYTSANAPYMDEPNADRFTTTAQIQVPYAAGTWLAGHLSGALYKVRLVHTASGSLIHEVGLPSLKIDEATTAFSDMADLPHEISFVGAKAISTPSGMASTPGTVPYVQATNSLSTDPLA